MEGSVNVTADTQGGVTRAVVDDPTATVPTNDIPKPETPQRPDHVPEKFWDAEKGQVNTEALLKSYQELEKARSKPADKADKATSADDAATKAVQNAGLDMSKLTAEFEESGSLSDASYEALQRAGIPREFVDAYIEGQQALAARQTQEVYGIAGGEEGFNAMTEWAKANLPRAEADEYNRLVTSGDFAAVKAAVSNLHAKYQQAVGKTGTTLEGDKGATNDVYESVEEYLRDAQDPKYDRDPAFRQRVVAKWIRSNVYDGARVY